MPSADSCAPVRSPCGSLSSKVGTWRRPPWVSSIAFPAPLPNSTALAFDEYGLRGPLPARPARDASYSVSVRQAAVLLRTSFRHRLAVMPLCFAKPSPPSGWLGDFHPQTIEHARHTTEAATSTHTSSRMSARPQRIEVITRGERRRHWSLEEKQAIVVESTGLLYAWRHQLLGRRSDEAACFARVDVMSEPHLLTGPGTAASTQRLIIPAALSGHRFCPGASGD